MNAVAENRPTELHLLNYALPESAAEQPLTLHVALRDYALRPHDAHTRREARAVQGFLRHVPDAALTHYLEAPLPSDAVAMMEVTRPTQVDGHAAEHTVHLAIHVPREGVQRAVEHLRSRNAAPWAVHPKLARYAHLLGGGLERDPFPDHITDWKTATEAAQALLFTHPDLINLSAEQGGRYPAYILENCVLRALHRSGTLIEYIDDLGDRWMKTEPAVGPDGQPLRDKDGKPVYTRIVHNRVQTALSGALGIAIKLAKGDEYLRGEQWNVQYGVTTAPYRALARDATEHPPLHAAEERSLAAGPYKWALANRTPGSGLVVDPNLSYTPATQQGEFTVSDIWMSTDQGAELSPAVVQDLLAEKIQVSLRTAASGADGVLRATLKCDGAAKDREPVRFKAEFAAQGGSTATASGSFVLNDLRTALTFTLKARQLGAAPSGAFSAGGKTLREFRIVDDSANGTLTLRCTNEWLRHLSACVQYRDEKNAALVPAAWSEKIPSFLRAIFQQDDKTKFVELVPPVRTVFGIPIPPDPTSISIPVPPDARSIQVYFGGLGRGGSYDTAVCPVGTAVTIVAEMALPLILLFAGTAVTNSKAVVSLMADKEVLFAVCTVAGFLVAGGTATYIGVSQDPGRAVKDVAITLGPMLLSPATALGQWLLQKVAEGAAQRAVPFFNVFTTVVNGVVTAAQLSQTIIEVASSPWVFNAEITRAIDLDLTLQPDPRYSRFPDNAGYYEVSVVYDKGATLPKQTFQLAGAPPRSTPINVKFSDIPAGGRLKVYVFFYAPNGWQAGQGQTPWMDAKGTSGSTLRIERLEITTNEVPLSKSSVYRHVSKIAYDKAKARHFWQAADRSPDATAASPSPFPQRQVQRRLSITTAQGPAQMAYAWQATGLNQPIDDPSRPPSSASMYTLQNLSSLENAEESYATPKVGFTHTPGVFYDLTAPGDGGRHFFVDPSRGPYDLERNHAGGMHLRRVTLGKGARPEFATGSNQSWGRFPFPMDRYVLHPQGVVLGVSYSTHMLWILPLPAQATTDDKAPQATMAGGEGKREGLLDGPRAIAVGLDGRVLVLEGGNQRVQAFDLAGKPVRYFKNPAGGDKLTSMALMDPADSTYLDLAVEAKGYLYVLRRRGGESPESYQVDLYEPDGSFLVSTPRVTADKLTVDLLRNMYTLNYETILGHGDRTEPSVSLWIPPAPPA